MRLFIICSAFIAAAVFTETSAQTPSGDFGRFRLGMSVDEAIAAAPEQQWERQAFGEDLITLLGSRVDVGRLPFRPILDFRDGHLNVLRLVTGGPVGSADQCDQLLISAVGVLEQSLGVFDGAPAPGEYGPSRIASRQLSGGSDVRFYAADDGAVRLGFATQRRERFVQASSLTMTRDNTLSCELEVALQAPLSDFEPLTPPTAAERAAVQEIPAADWAATADSRIFELTFPPSAMARGESGRVRLDCLVIDDAKVNCAIEQEQPVGRGFGDAALAVSRFYRVEPVVDGVPTPGKRVRLVIRFHGPGPLPPRE